MTDYGLDDCGSIPDSVRHHSVQTGSGAN